MQWMTKCGSNSPSTPFITHTPYCVEALLKYHDLTNDQKSMNVALSSLAFLEQDLKILFQDETTTALSYAPQYENELFIMEMRMQ